MTSLAPSRLADAVPIADADLIVEQAVHREARAPVVHTFRGKEFIEYGNPYDVGMTGLLWLPVRLSGDGALRRAPDAGDRFPVRDLQSGVGPDHPG